MFDVERVIELIAKILALMLVLPLHEFAHAFAAVKSGDVTPKLYHRYTINPLAHFDLLGLACFAFAGFGWAKPVPVNPNNFNHYKRGCFFVSIAGVTANYLTAFIVAPLVALSFLVPDFGFFDDVLQLALLYTCSFSLSFCVFNLIPVYPLDGFRVVDVFSKKRSKIYNFLRYQGIYVLYFLFLLSIVSDITGVWQIDILGYLLSKVVGYISIPIVWFWGLIL